MIATRFRSVVSAAAVAGAALGFYLISLNVAAERNELLKVERQIVAVKSDMRYLQTEFGTRSRLSELERWNGDVLALQAAAPKQYVKDGVQLAALVTPPAPVQPIPPAIKAQSTIEDAGVRLASFEATAPKAAPVSVAPAPAEPMLRQATYIKPTAGTLAPAPEKVALKVEKVSLPAAPKTDKVAPKPAKVAGLLNDDLLGEISKVARKEKAKAAQ
ncbi:hypothetical protein [Sphingomonas sp. ID0503]|uniref:hypothetical protein n=1 Tax=Sphingomonas sp. ID0503 TaxID=3399691 RepID=UPI003AFAEB01